MQTITLNIGLKTNRGAALSVQDVLDRLHYNTNIIDIGTKHSTTEPTLIVQCHVLAHDLHKLIYAIAVDLHQDCIAVSFDGGTTGQLIGPHADKWGDFNPEYFLTL